MPNSKSDQQFANPQTVVVATATVAQLAEQSLRKRRVVGSSPTGGSSFFPILFLDPLLYVLTNIHIGIAYFSTMLAE